VSAAEIPGLAELRRWIMDDGVFGHPVRTEAARLSLSAVVRRLALFGMEASFAGYSPRELLQLAVMVEGEPAAWFARTGLSRAYVVGDDEVVAAARRTGFAPELHAWHDERRHADPARAAELLASTYTDPEALHATRLAIARSRPELIEAGWLWEVPDRVAIIGHHLARCAARRPDLGLAVAECCARRRDLLMADDPDGILVPLVEAASVPPQTLLRPFAGLYGEASVVAAARWHLERGEPAPAIELVGRIRELAPEADHARLVAVLAELDRGAVDRALAVRGMIVDPDLLDQADLAIAARGAAAVGDDAVAALAARCGADRPERFLAALRLLLDRRRLDLARTLARDGARFAGHPVLAQVFAALGVR
jgi:hypothetical protein